MCIWYCWKYSCDRFSIETKDFVKENLLHSCLASSDLWRVCSSKYIFHSVEKHIIFVQLLICIGSIDTWLQISGICMMLIISVLRYRAIVHPLKLSFTRRKIKVACGLVYIIGFVTTVGIKIEECIVDPQGRYYIYECLVFYACFHIFR